MTQTVLSVGTLDGVNSKIDFFWKNACQKSYEDMEALIYSDFLRVYPDHNLPFDIHTYFSDYQIGVVIIQSGKVVSYWNKNLTGY